jgi:hypothetical protein
MLNHLHRRVHFGNGPVSVDQMYNWFCKDTNISRDRFDDAFGSLSRLGYFTESDDDGNKKWKLSPFGVNWVEDYYSFSQPDKSNQSLNYTPRFDGTIMIGTRRQKYLNELAAEATGNKVAVDIQSAAHWTKSGAIAAWLAIPVAIIAILITIIWSK